MSCLCACIISFQDEQAVRSAPVMYSNQTNVFFALEAQSFISANHLYGSIHQGLGLRVRVSFVRRTRGADEPFQQAELLSRF